MPLPYLVSVHLVLWYGALDVFFLVALHHSSDSVDPIEISHGVLVAVAVKRENHIAVDDGETLLVDLLQPVGADRVGRGGHRFIYMETIGVGTKLTKDKEAGGVDEAGCHVSRVFSVARVPGFLLQNILAEASQLPHRKDQAVEIISDG